MTNKDGLKAAKKVLKTILIERDRIINGQLLEIEDDIEARVTAMEAISVPKADASGEFIAVVRQILHESQRNSELINAAAQGIAEAQSYISELVALRTSLGTYDASGQKSGGPVGAESISKRA